MSGMRQRGVICLMLMLVSSPKPLNGAVTKDGHIMSIFTPSTTTTTTTTTAAAAAKDDDDDDDDDDEKSKLLDDVLSSLEAAFQFIITESANLNLDAIIGTRMVEGIHSEFDQFFY